MICFFNKLNKKIVVNLTNVRILSSSRAKSLCTQKLQIKRLDYNKKTSLFSLPLKLFHLKSLF